MKIILASTRVRVLQDTINKLPLLIQEKYNLLHCENDIIYLIQVCIARNNWVTKKIIFREHYKNILKKIFTMKEIESDESMMYRVQEEFYKYCRNYKSEYNNDILLR